MFVLLQTGIKNLNGRMGAQTALHEAEYFMTIYIFFLKVLLACFCLRAGLNKYQVSQVSNQLIS